MLRAATSAVALSLDWRWLKLHRARADYPGTSRHHHGVARGRQRHGRAGAGSMPTSVSQALGQAA